MRPMTAMSYLGQRWGIGWLTYNPLLFAWYHLRARLDAPGVVGTLGGLWPTATRYLDVGAGSGTYSATAQRLGKQVVACEHSRFGRLMAALQGVHVQSFDLEKELPPPLDESFDLALCLEVAEHLAPSLGDRLVDFLALRAPVVVFTAAPPGQGGIGHVNEQPKAYWIARFERRGMRYRAQLSRLASEGFVKSEVYSDYLSHSVMVFEREG
jgi:SAM-dependent methyltransferase